MEASRLFAVNLHPSSQYLDLKAGIIMQPFYFIMVILVECLLAQLKKFQGLTKHMMYTRNLKAKIVSVFVYIAQWISLKIGLWQGQIEMEWNSYA